MWVNVMLCGQNSLGFHTEDRKLNNDITAVLIGIYGLTVAVKVILLIKHFFHLRFPARYITVISSL